MNKYYWTLQYIFFPFPIIILTTSDMYCKLWTAAFEHLHLRTFCFRRHFNTKSLFLCFYTSALEEKKLRHVAATKAWISYLEERCSTGLFSLSEINVMFIFHTCMRSEFPPLNPDSAAKTVIAFIHRLQVVFLHETSEGESKTCKPVVHKCACKHEGILAQTVSVFVSKCSDSRIGRLVVWQIGRGILTAATKPRWADSSPGRRPFNQTQSLIPPGPIVHWPYWERLRLFFLSLEEKTKTGNVGSFFFLISVQFQ